MRDDPEILADLWRVRNAAAVTLGLAEDQTRSAVRAASVGELMALIETFSPARSTGPEWARTLDPLIERLWAWCDDQTMAALAEAFRARGAPWMAVTNALSIEHGERLRATPRQPAWARRAALAVI
jgi:hypothetical protein